MYFVSAFVWQVREDFSLPPTGWTVYTKRDKSEELKSSSRKTLSSYKIKYDFSVVALTRSCTQSTLLCLNSSDIDE